MGQEIIETSASVSLDGAVLKRLREEKRLTQLYVSKVVGVTTDTISRWENNRYPTMRRDNALRLAEALEVSIEDLLRLPPAGEAPPTTAGTRKPWVLAASLAVGLLLVGLAIVLTLRHRQTPAPITITAERVLPPYAAPGTAIPVQVRLAQRSAESGFILRETLPKGWQLLQANPPASSLDNDSGIVRWIIKADDPRDRIVYLAKVSERAVLGSYGEFRGEIIAGSGDSKAAAVPVAGAGRVAVAPVLWADLDGDGRIDDSEMLQASHTVDEMAGVHIDWLELERFWNAGSYRWVEGGQHFEPVKALEISPR